MSKRKRRKQRKSRPASRPKRHRPPPVEVQEAFRRAEDLVDRGRAQEAVELLEPLLVSYARVSELHYHWGYACVQAGDIWEGLAGYERALELSRDPRYWRPLASLYLDLDLNAHALHAFRQVLRRGVDVTAIDDIHKVIAWLEQDIGGLAQNLQLPMAQAERGLRYLEVGSRALQKGDFSGCISANRRAIKLLAGWPPPSNNLSLALFFSGQPNEAIMTARQVLSKDPDNIQALGNAIRFLAWTGQKREAQALWSRLKVIKPEEASDRLKMAEAAAILQKDERVYDLLNPLDRDDTMRVGTPEHRRGVQLFLAVAEANLGKHTAQGRLKVLQGSVSWAGELLRALEAGRPGPGWSDRFPYFHSTEVVTRRRMEEFVELVSRQDKISPQRFRSQMTRFVARVPQIVIVAEKLIWEENESEAGIGILKTVGTPAAHAVLRRFGLSQVGDDGVRMQALQHLLEAGQIAQNETLRVWNQGEWREIQLRRYEVSDEPRSEYTREVADLMNRGLQSFQRDDHLKAERLFRRALDSDPSAKEACNNLGTIYARRDEHAQAREMFQAALEIDPLYVLPRCNLATYLLDDGDVDGAIAMLAPLAGVTRFHRQEMAFYSYTQARVSIHRKDYEAARNALQAALEVWPGYEMAEELLEHLEMVSRISTGFGSFFEQQRKRDRAKRARLQAKLSTLDPPLVEALPLYSKEVLTGMARVILPYGGWSGLRKAELLERVVEELGHADTVERLVAQLSDTERAALHQVLAGGGHMPWHAFDAQYVNDLEESQYWQYHEPKTTMGRLRLRGLLVETTVNDELLVAVPRDLRQVLGERLD
ncbi:tetratricopeptide repeat protein [Chloroflexota bacterium]